MKTLLSLCCFFCLLLNFSCREVYNPEMDTTKKVLVVDGLITDEPRSYNIRISTSIPYDSVGYVPVKGAIVYVTDNHGNQYFFEDKGEGNYKSDPQKFKTQIGDTYTLTVEANNLTYTSAPQKLLPREEINDLNNYVVRKKVYLNIGKSMRYLITQGTEFTTLLNLENNNDPYFRFSNTEFIEYIQTYLFSGWKIGKDSFFYSWKKYYPNLSFNINEKSQATSTKIKHDLGFYPIDTSYLSIVFEIQEHGTFVRLIKKDIFQYLISFKKYHINKDVFDYYQSLNKQLNGDQRILDPRAFQVKGNIRCISDSTIQAFGIFEASSSTVKTFKIDKNLSSDSYKTKQVFLDPDTISEEGMVLFEPPQFWIF